MSNSGNPLEEGLLSQQLPGYESPWSALNNHVLGVSGHDIDWSVIGKRMIAKNGRGEQWNAMHTFKARMDLYFQPEAGDIVYKHCDVSSHGQPELFKAQWSGTPSKPGFQRYRTKIKSFTSGFVHFENIEALGIAYKAPSTDSELCKELFGPVQWYDESTWKAVPRRYVAAGQPPAFIPDRFLDMTYMMRKSILSAKPESLKLRVIIPGNEHRLIPFHHVQKILMQGGEVMYVQDLFAEHHKKRAQELGEFIYSIMKGDDNLEPRFTFELDYLNKIKNRAGAITMTQWAYDRYITDDGVV